MPKTSNQKKKLLYLMDLLLQNTDEEHPMSMKTIISELASLGISAERKSIYSDIEVLCDYGIDIVTENNGYFVASRKFEQPELKMMVDCVSASKFISEKKSGELIKKLESLTSRYEAEKLQRQVYIVGRIKNQSKGLYYNVDKISRAIVSNCKISFHYFVYDINKEKQLKHGGERYVVTPLGMTVSDENYYLVAYYEKYEGISHFRIDRMADIEILKGKEKPVAKGFDMAEYSKSIFSMYSGEKTRVSLLCDMSIVTPVIDRLGKDVFLQKEDEGHFLVVTPVSLSPTFYAWVFTFGGKMKIKSPDRARDEFQNMIDSFAE